MKWSDLARRLMAYGARAGIPPSGSAAGANPEIHRACFDSREVQSGDLFCALPGTRLQGSAFVEQALTRGAAGLLMAAPAGPQLVPTLEMDSQSQLLRAAGEAAHWLAGEPSGALWCAAVTGTNGKTTTVHLLAQVLDACGLPCARAGTLGFAFGATAQPTRETTVAADRLHAWLAQAARAGARACAFEASSHGIVQQRLAGVRLSAAAWTNLTHDHLDFHGTLEAYAAAKARLFVELPQEAVGFIPVAYGPARVLVAGSSARILSWGLSTEAATNGDLRARASCSASGVELNVDGALGVARVRSTLAGLHNAENLLLAWALARAAGVACEAAAEALGRAHAAPGRLERVAQEAPWNLFVDYAHTPDAIARVLSSLRASFPQRRIGVVFGAGGDRDPRKRAAMGRAAAEGADWCLVTSDNPRSEDPASIAEAVAAGVRAVRGTAELELDRRSAIRLALTRMQPGEVLLVAGKGHEDYQEIRGVRHPFDDRQELTEAVQCLA